MERLYVEMTVVCEYVYSYSSAVITSIFFCICVVFSIAICKLLHSKINLTAL